MKFTKNLTSIALGLVLVGCSTPNTRNVKSSKFEIESYGLNGNVIIEKVSNGAVIQLCDFNGDSIYDMAQVVDNHGTNVYFRVDPDRKEMFDKIEKRLELYKR